MARSMWRGAIQFGLVTIPVKLYLATEARGGLAFHLLHKSCLTRIQMKTYCPEHDETVSRADTVRGYEWSKGKYVVIEDEDLESVPLKTVRSIEIELFVEAAREDNARFVKQAYYLEPEAIGRKPFYLLKSVLAETGKSAVCKIVLKDREQLAALNPYSSTMLLTTLHWPDEIRSLEDLDLPEAELEGSYKPAERKMAEQLVAAMTGEFRPDEYRDEYREALSGVIEAKIQGQPKAEAAPAPQTGKLVDLMAALEASVTAARETRKGEAAPREDSSEEPATPVAIGEGAGARRRRSGKAASASADAASTDGKRPRRRERAGAQAEQSEAEESSKPVAASTRAPRAERRRKSA